MAGRIGKPRKSGAPAPATIRKITILLDLVRHKRISLKSCEVTYGAAERTVLRDLQELRAIGKQAGFSISEREDRDYFTLARFDARPKKLAEREQRFRALMSELFKAFGAPVGNDADGLNEDGASGSFVQLALPKLVAQEAVARIFAILEDAWAKSARVRFRYRGKERTIEPARAIVRSGRYYLVGRDVACGKNGWRNFAMDVIEEPIALAGTFTRTAPPARYLSTDAIGFFKGDGPSRSIDVTFSKDVAKAAASREWQRDQRVCTNLDGSVTISLTVDDVDEVVRWALSYGDDAWVSAPPDAVARAKEVVERIRQRYERTSTALHQG